MSKYEDLDTITATVVAAHSRVDATSLVKPPRITRTRWQLVRWHLRCAWLHFLGRL